MFTSSASSSSIVTVALVVPRDTPDGSGLSVSASRLTVKVSLPSASVSALVCTVSDAAVAPAAMVTAVNACAV